MTVDGDGTSIGSKVLLGILGGNAALDGNTTGTNVLLDETDLAEGGAGSNAKLGLDNVNTGDLLGDGVLDLDTGIDFNEVGLHVGGIHQELNGTSILVVGTGGQIAGILVELLAQFIGQGPSGGHLNDLLVAPLNGAIALVQMNDVAGAIAKDLDLNVTGTLDELLHEDGTVAETGQSLARGGLEEGLDVLHVADDAHALAATAHGGLDDDGEAVLVDKGLDLLGRFEGTVGTGNDGDAGLDGGLAGAGLVGEGVEVINGRTDKGDAAVGAGLGKLGRFGQETVAGVDGIDAGLLGNRDDLGDVQVGRDGGGRVLLLKEEGLVGSPSVLGVAILVAVDGDSRHVELDAGADNAHRDLGAVRRHDLAERRGRGRRGHEVGHDLGRLGGLGILGGGHHGQRAEGCRRTIANRRGTTDPDGRLLREGADEGGAGQDDGRCREDSHDLYGV
mmetsp:Transcript_11580/g.32881  ORF Transcript_11580/g.32881 Transcript_11580/m.32881 type:complete len:447 (+) Transcript_11580:2577-3917(+)